MKESKDFKLPHGDYYAPVYSVVFFTDTGYLTLSFRMVWACLAYPAKYLLKNEQIVSGFHGAAWRPADFGQTDFWQTSVCASALLTNGLVDGLDCTLASCIILWNIIRCSLDWSKSASLSHLGLVIVVFSFLWQVRFSAFNLCVVSNFNYRQSWPGR